MLWPAAPPYVGITLSLKTIKENKPNFSLQRPHDVVLDSLNKVRHNLSDTIYVLLKLDFVGTYG